MNEERTRDVGDTKIRKEHVEEDHTVVIACNEKRVSTQASGSSENQGGIRVKKEEDDVGNKAQEGEEEMIAGGEIKEESWKL